jgi:hypothetical protein
MELRIIFWPKRDDVTGGWIKLHNEEFQNVSSSPSIIEMMKSRNMSWTDHIARMWRGGMRIGYCGKGTTKKIQLGRWCGWVEKY